MGACEFPNVRGPTKSAAVQRLPNGLRYSYGGHAGSGCGFDAEFRVLKDEAIGRGDAEALRAKQETIGSGLAMRVVFGADEGVELSSRSSNGEGADDGGARLPETTAKGMRPYWASTCSRTAGNRLELRQLLVIEKPLCAAATFDRHIQAHASDSGRR